MRKRTSLMGMGVVLVMYLLILCVLMMERSGIRVNDYVGGAARTRVQSPSKQSVAAKQEKECLVLYNSENEESLNGVEQFHRILMDMKVGYDEIDVTKEEIPSFSEYRTAVILLNSLKDMGEDVLIMADWVRDGGRVLMAIMPENDTNFQLIQQKLGVEDADYNYALVDSMYFDPDFLLGGGQSYEIADAYDSALKIMLHPDRAHAVARIGDETGMPLIWYTDYGKGRFVVDNFGLMEKATCGIFAASYSLLEDAFIYPVLNGQVYYLDDFPSPVPGGDGTYIARDYNMDISTFYSQVWWPDMLKMAEKWGIRYTGVVIENYGDDTSGVIEEQKDTGRFQYFGNMLLHMGGEIGYHGYNHQPFSYTGETDYGDALPYNTWPDDKASENALAELQRFVEEQFVTNKASVYVPPSNVISENGERMIAERFPSIVTIAGSYFDAKDEFVRGQEFEQAENGLIHQPRVTSGEFIEAYTRLVALSELNFHDVNTHFVHPDDTLDEDRGAELGWAKLYEMVSKYMDWLFESAPHIRRLTGGELSQVIGQFSAASVRRELTENSLTVAVNEDAVGLCFFMRLNRGTLAQAEGCTAEALTDTLYLVTPQQTQFTLRWQ